MQAIVLAGGKGTRMYPFTREHGKSLLELGRKPVLQHIVEKLSKTGFSEVIVAIPRKDVAKAKSCLILEDERLALRFFISDRHPGTANILKGAENLLAETFLVHYGDIISNINLQDMMTCHRELCSIATMALVKGKRLEVGVVEIDPSLRVVSFDEKPQIPSFVNGAIYVFERSALKHMRSAKSIEKSIVRMIGSGERVFGYATDAYWHNLTHPSDYLRVARLVSSGKLDTARSDAARLAQIS